MPGTLSPSLNSLNDLSPISPSIVTPSPVMPILTPSSATGSGNGSVSSSSPPSTNTIGTQQQQQQQQRAFKPSSRAQTSLVSVALGGKSDVNDKSSIASPTAVHPYHQSLHLSNSNSGSTVGGVPSSGVSLPHRLVGGTPRLHSPLPHRVTSSPLRIHSPIPRHTTVGSAPLTLSSLSPSRSPRSISPTGTVSATTPNAASGGGIGALNTPNSFNESSNQLGQIQAYPTDMTMPNSNMIQTPVLNPAPITPTGQSSTNSPLPLAVGSMSPSLIASQTNMMAANMNGGYQLMPTNSTGSAGMWQRSMNNMVGPNYANSNFPPSSAVDPNPYFYSSNSNNGSQSPAHSQSFNQMPQTPYSPSALNQSNNMMSIYGNSGPMPQQPQQVANAPGQYTMTQPQTQQMNLPQPYMSPNSYSSPLAYYAPASNNSPVRVNSPMPLHYGSTPPMSVPPTTNLQLTSSQSQPSSASFLSGQHQQQQQQGQLSPLTIPNGNVQQPQLSSPHQYMMTQSMQQHPSSHLQPQPYSVNNNLPSTPRVQYPIPQQSNYPLSGAPRNPVGLPYEMQRRASVPSSFHSMLNVAPATATPTPSSMADPSLPTSSASYSTFNRAHLQHHQRQQMLQHFQQQQQIHPQLQSNYRSNVLPPQHQAQHIHQMQQLYALDNAQLSYNASLQQQQQQQHPLNHPLLTNTHPMPIQPPMSILPQLSTDPSSSLSAPNASLSSPSVNGSAAPSESSQGNGTSAGKSSSDGQGSTATATSTFSSAVDPSAQKKGRDYICSQCAEVLHSRFSLKRHIKKHTGNKPHRCTFGRCTKSFFEASTLKRHMRIHTGDKPFLCRFPNCNKAFSDATNVKRHEITHTGAKPFTCPQPGCDRAFTRNSSLQLHQRSCHGKEDEENEPNIASKDEREESKVPN